MTPHLRLLASVLPAAMAAFAQYPAARQGGQYLHNYYIPPAPSTTPWSPAWSPDGQTLAVAMHGSLWRLNPHTGSATEITADRLYHSSPAWSPDGRWIVYTADDDARRVQLWILKVATGETRSLTDDLEVYLDPVFSPDGAMLAYVTTKPHGNFQIRVRPIREGWWAGDEIALTTEHRHPRARLYFSAWDIATQPAWTPDGREIVFVANRDVPLGSGDLWRMPAEPDGIRKAVRVLAEQTLFRTRPHVSPDGRRVLYSSTGGAADQYNHLYVLPLDGGAPYKLTFGDFDEFHPRWSPDGETIAYVSNQGGLPQLWLLETYGGKRTQVVIRDKRWKRTMGKLHVRVLDAATRRPLAARVHGLASDGKFYAPEGSYSRIGRSGLHSFHTAGEFSVDVPPGRMTLEAVHGFDYQPAAAEVDITPGAATEATLALKRVANPAAKGWYSASTHVHMNYGGNLRNTPQNLQFMARAEGLDAVMDLAANKDNRVLDHQFFGHDLPNIHFGEEYRPPFYGHAFFIGLRDHLLSPFTTGYEGTAIDSLYPSNTDMFRKAKAQGAVTGYVHAFSGDGDPLEADLGVGKAFPVDAALGAVDALEWSTASRAALRVWHHALNNDLAVTPTGGEDSITNLHRTKLIGSVRTYAAVGPKFSLAAWIEALRQGRTYFSTGPLLDFRINSQVPGESLCLPVPGKVLVEASVQSIAPLSKVVIYRNGQEWRTLVPAVPFKEMVDVAESAWYSLYAEGPPYRQLDGEFPQAATNAIRVYVAERPIRNAESARYFERWIARLRTMAEAWPWWRSDAERAHVFQQFDKAAATFHRMANGQ